MRPSLTPYQDAVRRLSERDPRSFDHPADAAVTRVLRAAEMELAALLDHGVDEGRILGFASAVTASLLDTIASSAAIEAVGAPPVPARRRALLQVMLQMACDHLSNNKPGYQASEVVANAPTGRA